MREQEVWLCGHAGQRSSMHSSCSAHLAYHIRHAFQPKCQATTQLHPQELGATVRSLAITIWHHCLAVPQLRTCSGGLQHVTRDPSAERASLSTEKGASKCAPFSAPMCISAAPQIKGGHTRCNVQVMSGKLAAQHRHSGCASLLTPSAPAKEHMGWPKNPVAMSCPIPRSNQEKTLIYI